MGNYPGISVVDFLKQQAILVTTAFNLSDSLKIGGFTRLILASKKLSSTFKVRIQDWITHYVILPSSLPENQSWIDFRAKVVNLKHRSTMYERESAKQQGINSHKANNLLLKTLAIHDSELPLITNQKGFVTGVVIHILSQVEDYILRVKVLTIFIVQG